MLLMFKWRCSDFIPCFLRATWNSTHTRPPPTPRPVSLTVVFKWLRLYDQNFLNAWSITAHPQTPSCVFCLAGLPCHVLYFPGTCSIEKNGPQGATEFSLSSQCSKQQPKDPYVTIWQRKLVWKTHLFSSFQMTNGNEPHWGRRRWWGEGADTTGGIGLTQWSLNHELKLGSTPCFCVSWGCMYMCKCTGIYMSERARLC